MIVCGFVAEGRLPVDLFMVVANHDLRLYPIGR
jgi:hypothetical protein